MHKWPLRNHPNVVLAASSYLDHLLPGHSSKLLYTLPLKPVINYKHTLSVAQSFSKISRDKSHVALNTLIIILVNTSVLITQLYNMLTSSPGSIPSCLLVDFNTFMLTGRSRWCRVLVGRWQLVHSGTHTSMPFLGRISVGKAQYITPYPPC